MAEIAEDATYAAVQALARLCGCERRSSWCRSHWPEAAAVLDALSHYGMLADPHARPIEGGNRG